MMEAMYSMGATPQYCSSFLPQKISALAGIRYSTALVSSLTCKHLRAPPGFARCRQLPSAEVPIANHLQTVLSFELPPLHSRFPMALHPDHESVREECESWGLSLMAASASAAERQAYFNGRYYLLGSIFFPLCYSRRRLILLSKFNIFAFIFDDVMELTEPQEAARLLRAAVAAFQGRSDVAAATVPSIPAALSASEAQMAALLSRFRTDVWDEMCRDMSPAFKASLESQMLEYMQKAGVDQVDGTRHESVEDCVAYRTPAAGGEVFLQLVEYSLEIEIGEQQLKSIASMTHFRKALLNHYVWVNDLLSFRKELLHDGGLYAGRGTVGVLIAQAAAAASTGSFHLQDIINKLWDMIQEEEVRIAGLVDEIKAQFAPSSDIVKYVDALCAGLSTHMYWYTASGRYGLQHVNFFHNKPTIKESPTIVRLDGDPTLQITMKSLPFSG